MLFVVALKVREQSGEILFRVLERRIRKQHGVRIVRFVVDSYECFDENGPKVRIQTNDADNFRGVEHESLDLPELIRKKLRERHDSSLLRHGLLNPLVHVTTFS